MHIEGECILSRWVEIRQNYRLTWGLIESGDVGWRDWQST